MKEYFNSFDDIQFFHTFSSLSRDMKIVTLNEIHRYIQNFILYKMIYFSSHKFAFSNLRFSPFNEHFRQLREKYPFKLKDKVHHVNQLIEADLMMCIHMTFSIKKTTPLHSTPLHSTHSTELFKIFFSLLTLSTAFLQKASGPGKNTLISFLSFCFIIRNIKSSKSVDARSILLNTVNSAEGLVLVVLCCQEQKGKLLLPVSSCATILSRPP